MQGDVGALAGRLAAGDRRALARAITLVESTRPEDRRRAVALLDALGPRPEAAVRIGLTGAPGVGKSTFVEALGCRLVGRGLSVAVLAVDPSSGRTGGSILGDKTRMERLARAPGAFIRPSPAGGELGGVARRTRDAAALCEAAGFDVVLIETVGVGQSEVAVAGMTDAFVLLLAPGGGDELQGVKRGIMELADLILVTKADGELAGAAARTAADHAAALRLLRPRDGDAPGFPQAMTVSAMEARGLDAAWDALAALLAHRRASGWLERARAGQALAWFEAEVRRGVLDRIATDRGLAERMAAAAEAVRGGRISPSSGAAQVLDGLDRLLGG